jgi:hypothetical protein
MKDTKNDVKPVAETTKKKPVIIQIDLGAPELKDITGGNRCPGQGIE